MLDVTSQNVILCCVCPEFKLIFNKVINIYLKSYVKVAGIIFGGIVIVLFLSLKKAENLLLGLFQ